MADNNSVSLSQDDINLVLSIVRTENDAHNKEDALLGVGLSQSDLDQLFTAKPATVVQEEPRQLTPEEKRAAKIAERKARAAALLAKVNAESPRRVHAVYGSTLLSGNRISDLAPGDTLDFERSRDNLVDILVDDKVIARGLMEARDGHCSVKLTEVHPR